MQSFAQTIVFYDTALDVWRDLQERFSKIDRIRIATFRSTINNLKQGSKSVLDYFTELKALWEELASHKLIPNCSCIHTCRLKLQGLLKLIELRTRLCSFLQVSITSILLSGHKS